MFHIAAGEGKLTEAVCDHRVLDQDLLEFLSIMDLEGLSHHLWEDDHVAAVRLYTVLALAQLLEQRLFCLCETSFQFAARVSRHKTGELGEPHLLKLFEVISAI